MLSALMKLCSLWMYDYLIFETGCPETLVLNMSNLVWSVLDVVKQKDPLSSEVITLCNLFIQYFSTFPGRLYGG